MSPRLEIARDLMCAALGNEALLDRLTEVKKTVLDWAFESAEELIAEEGKRSGVDDPPAGVIIADMARRLGKEKSENEELRQKVESLTALREADIRNFAGYQDVTRSEKAQHADQMVNLRKELAAKTQDWLTACNERDAVRNRLAGCEAAMTGRTV